MNRNKILIVMAAGSGVRMGATVPKQFLDLGGVPILRRTIEAFVSAVPDIKVVTVLPEDHIPFWKEYCLSSGFNCPQTLVSGGFTRFHSVRNALKKVPDGAIVAIHDGVRPLLSAELIRNMFARMDSGGVRALIPVIPSVDTLKVIDRVKDQDGNEVMVSPEERWWTEAGFSEPRPRRCFCQRTSSRHIHKPLTPLSLTMPLWRVKKGYPSPSVTERGIISN